jgi:hypothetical protein
MCKYNFGKNTKYDSPTAANAKLIISSWKERHSQKEYITKNSPRTPIGYSAMKNVYLLNVIA